MRVLLLQPPFVGDLSRGAHRFPTLDGAFRMEEPSLEEHPGPVSLSPRGAMSFLTVESGRSSRAGALQFPVALPSFCGDGVSFVPSYEENPTGSLSKEESVVFQLCASTRAKPSLQMELSIVIFIHRVLCLPPNCDRTPVGTRDAVY